MSITIPWLRPAKHDPDTVIRRLRGDVTSLLNRQAAADDYFALLTQDRDEVYACWQEAKQQRDEASMVAACVQSERDQLADEVTALKAQLANATAVSTPVGVRDIDPDDQPTHPTGIDVTELRARFTTGPVVALHHSPQAVADPGQTAWGARNQQQEVA